MRTEACRRQVMSRGAQTRTNDGRELRGLLGSESTADANALSFFSLLKNNQKIKSTTLLSVGPDENLVYRCIRRWTVYEQTGSWG
jgi:hypothetical protein